jgi:hypothetical protein
MINIILFLIFVGAMIGAVIVIDIVAIVAAGKADKSKLERPDLIELEEN